MLVSFGPRRDLDLHIWYSFDLETSTPSWRLHRQQSDTIKDSLLIIFEIRSPKTNLNYLFITFIKNKLASRYIAKLLLLPLFANFFETWPFESLKRNSTTGFCFGTRAKKLKYYWIIIYSLEWGSNPQPLRYSHTFVPLRRDGLNHSIICLIIKLRNLK